MISTLEVVPASERALHLPCHKVGVLIELVVRGTRQLLLKTNNLAVGYEALGLNQLRRTPVAQHPLQLKDRRMACFSKRLGRNRARAAGKERLSPSRARVAKASDS